MYGGGWVRGTEQTIILLLYVFIKRQNLVFDEEENILFLEVPN